MNLKYSNLWIISLETPGDASISFYSKCLLNNDLYNFFSPKNILINLNSLKVSSITSVFLIYYISQIHSRHLINTVFLLQV